MWKKNISWIVLTTQAGKEKGLLNLYVSIDTLEIEIPILISIS